MDDAGFGWIETFTMNEVHMTRQKHDGFDTGRVT